MGDTAPLPEPALSVAPSGPITGAERIVSLDVLRGFAVLGILVMNIQSFSMPGTAYVNPTVYENLEGVNYAVWYGCHLLADMKFMSIFSMLFGAGIVVMTSRREATGESSAGVHYRRMGWLLLFGLLHAYGLWYGDILFTYALCGLVAWLFRRLPPWALIALGVVAVTIGWGAGKGLNTVAPSPVEQATAWWAPPPETVQAEVDAYRGGWLDQMGHRALMAVIFQTLLLLLSIGWRAGGMMLLGMALFKLGVFSATRSRGLYITFIAVAIVVGLPTIGYGVHRNEAAEWSVEYSFRFGTQYNYWASILVALGWVGAVMLACQAPALGLITRPLAAVGRMALTNYLMQTIICTTIFYGHGFGYFGSFSRVEQLLTVVAVWVFQLVVSPIWLRYFQFGPFEWLWRSLTYLKPQPVLKESDQ